MDQRALRMVRILIYWPKGWGDKLCPQHSLTFSDLPVFRFHWRIASARKPVDTGNYAGWRVKLRDDADLYQASLAQIETACNRDVFTAWKKAVRLVFAEVSAMLTLL